MPKKIQNTTKATLISVPLPNHAATYTVISHQFVIDYAFQSLAAAGFGIVEEEYRCTADGQIAQGIYRLNFNSDPELSMMFAWTNSYNKQVKFKCVIGAYINETGSVMISGNIGNWVRKHTGTADTEVKDTIDQYVSNAHMYYTQLCSDKVSMEAVILNKRRQAQLLGVLFAEYEILTTEQASMIREQMKKPKQVFTNTDSLWAFYNFVTNALQYSHPKTWLEDQRILHYFIGTICNLSAPVQPVSAPVPDLTAPLQDLSAPVEEVDPLYVIPNQTNILDQIAEIEEETELVQYTDPAGNTFELPMLKESEIPVVETKAPQEFIDALMNAPEMDASEIDMSKVTWVDAPETVKEVEAKPKLSLDDILIRIPNEEKASLSPFEKMQQRLEEANARTEAESEAEEAEVVEDETPWYEETVPPTDLVIPEELETLQEKLEAREVKAIAVELLKEESGFDFDLSGDTEKPTEEANDFDFF